MRCVKCNVDLGEDYTVCPLCGSKAVNTAPLIPDQRTAEYPVLSPKKKSRDAFGVFLILWAAVGAAAFAAYLLNFIDKNVLGCIVMGVASIWAVAFRPVLVNQLYFGNYFAIGILPLSALAIYAQKAIGEDAEYAYSVAVPGLFTLAIAVMLIAAVAAKTSGKRAAPYGVLFSVAGIIGAAYCAISDSGSCAVWLSETAVSVLTVAVTLVIYRDKAVQELKAKFSV